MTLFLEQYFSRSYSETGVKSVVSCNEESFLLYLKKKSGFLNATRKIVPADGYIVHVTAVPTFF